MLGDFAVQGDWRHAAGLLDMPCFYRDISLPTTLRQKRKWLCTYVNSRNPTLAQESLALLAVVAHRKYRNEAAGLQGWGTGNLISPAPGVPKSLFNIFCFYSSKPPRGRIAHKRLNSLHGKKKKKKKEKITAWGNLKDESAVSLLTSVKMRAMEGTSHILDRH